MENHHLSTYIIISDVLQEHAELKDDKLIKLWTWGPGSG